MTTTTDTQLAAPATEARRWHPGRIVLAFIIGVLLVSVIAAGSVLAYEQSYAGKVAAGVTVGGVQVAGMTRDQAATALTSAFGSIGSGTLTVDTGNGPTTLTYAQLGRRLDVDTVLDEAFAIGRTGDPIQRVAEEARTALNRLDVAPLVVIDQTVLAATIASLAAKVDRDPVAAVVTPTTDSFAQSPAVLGRNVDQAAMAASISASLSTLNAPATLTMPLAVEPVSPTVTDADATSARTRADQMIAPVVLTHGKDQWTIPGAAVRSWVSFGTWPDGTYGPLVDPAKIQTAVAALSKKVDRKPVSASFYTSKRGSIVGVKAGSVGRTLDVPGTVGEVQALLLARAGGSNDSGGSIVPALAIVQPDLTTEEATKAAPNMRAISSWTTYYQSGAHNGFSANISIPSMAINGTVVNPGEWFSYWKTVGDVTLAKGYKLGGAIIDGHSVEGKSIGGGICSSSTTLFNAALRAGLQMGDRKNHYYYIARYPKGLDATVFKGDGGGVQDMTFRNDTKFPILIRTYARPGIIRFTLFSVPTGRRISFTRPTVKNYISGYTVKKYVTSLKPGHINQVEYPADGQDVWVTRTVRDKSGKLIHRDTYFSHYARMIGIILIGKKV